MYYIAMYPNKIFKANERNLEDYENTLKYGKV